MNRPPENHIRVSAEVLQSFVTEAAQCVGLPQDRADLLADLLTKNDLRGIFSHGTQQIATYAILMRDGKLNCNPEVSLVRETAVSALVDGDGGLGYFPAYEGTLRAIEKAKNAGMAAMMSRNHGHFGAAGIYARMALEEDLIVYVTSGHQLDLQPGKSLFSAGGGSPMAFGVPTEKHPPFVLDFGALHDFYKGELRSELSERAPGLVLRCIGMGEICQAWGGMLSGLGIDADKPRWTWPGANQGSLLIALRIDLFHETDVFKRDIDEYVDRIGALAPLEGFSESHVPGGIEAVREEAYMREGVPVGEWHRERLQGVANELGLSVPW